MHLEEARWMRDDVAFFQGVQSSLLKFTVGGSGKSEEDLNAAVGQIVSKAVTSDEVIDTSTPPASPSPTSPSSATSSSRTSRTAR